MDFQELDNTIDEATDRYAGIIVRAIKNIYGDDSTFDLARRSVLSALGNQGLRSELKRLMRVVVHPQANTQTS